MEGKGDIKSLWKVQEREVNKCIGVKGDWGLSKGLQPLDDDSVWYISKHSGEDWTVGRDVYVGCHSMCNFDKNKAFLSFLFSPLCLWSVVSCELTSFPGFQVSFPTIP